MEASRFQNPHNPMTLTSAQGLTWGKASALSFRSDRSWHFHRESPTNSRKSWPSQHFFLFSKHMVRFKNQDFAGNCPFEHSLAQTAGTQRRGYDRIGVDYDSDHLPGRCFRSRRAAVISA
jgi:hypothetical protein